MTGKRLLEIADLCKSFGDFGVLRNITLAVEQGEFLALVGPSGCGKTTLLKIIAGFESHGSGRLTIAGEDMMGVPPQSRPTSMVFQKLALFPHMTVAENIGFPLKLRKLETQAIGERVGAMIELMKLRSEYLTRYPRQLSGGEQQRVALARSMVSDPKLLLLDEPLSALDVKLKKLLQAELKRLHRQVGVTFVHVTHDLEEAMMLADRICVMRAGRVVQVGKPDDIYYRPVDAFVAGFIGETNIFPVEITERAADRIRFRTAEIEPNEGFVFAERTAPDVGCGKASMMVRPELVEVANGKRRCDFVLKAVVSEMFIKGSTVQYRARSAAGSEIVFEVAGTMRRPAAVGDAIRLGWMRDEVYLFQSDES
jgi:ABC-type Fe3+/spermidine/putrescine transport system ATPase subunit